MKKLLLFILVLTGIVNTASAATTRIFIQPDDWAASSAVLKVNLYYSGSYKSNYFLTNSDLYKTGIYYLDIDETQVNQFQLCREWVMFIIIKQMLPFLHISHVIIILLAIKAALGSRLLL